MTRWAAFVLRHPRKVVGLWLIILVVSGGLASQLETRVKNGGYTPPGSQTARAEALGERFFAKSSAPQVFVALTATHAAAPLLSDAAIAQRALHGVRGVEGIGQPMLSADRAAVLVPVVLHGDTATAQTYPPDINAALAKFHFPAAKVQLIGEAALYDRMGIQSKKSLAKSSVISFPVTLAVLLIAFLSVTAALLPLGLAAVCVGVTFGLLYLLSYLVALSVFVEDTVLVLGLGLSIDFSLFMVTRVREVLARDSMTVDAAITEAMCTTGRAIMISGITIVAALCGLYVTGLGIFSSLATGAIGATLLAVSAALTLAPAMLAMFGERLERFPIRMAVSAAGRGVMWRRLADFVVRRRVAVVSGAVLTLVVLSLPLTAMRISFPTIDVLPSSDPVRQAAVQVAHTFGPGAGVPAVVIARTSPVTLQRFLAAQPGIVALGPAQSGAQGWVRIAATLGVASDSSKAAAIVRRIRTALRKTIGPDAVVAGSTALGIDVVDRINARTPWVVLVVLLAEILLLTLVFAAPLIALKAAITTLLSVTAALGAMGFLFRGTGDITYFVPLFLFTIIFGLSTDYEVFLLSRVREHHRAGASNTESVKRALIGSGRSITLAGAAMSVVFFSFALSPLVPFQELGVGMGLAILIDVTIVRCLLVPAALALLGELNWWRPRVLSRGPALSPEQIAPGIPGVDQV
jgi:uncharacterized membrane protein YdfJ with MMPL/SSD domain